MSATQVTPVERRLFPIPDGANYLGVSIRQFKYLLADGEFAKVRIGARVLIDKKDLDAYVDRLKRAV